MSLLRIVLIALAAMRATRFFTSDKLGEWWIVGPAKLWATRREAVAPPTVPYSAAQIVAAAEAARIQGDAVPTPRPGWGWRSKLVSGLDCPFCVGFWVGALILLGDVLTRRVRPLRALYTFALGSLALNYAVGHASSRLDG